MHDNSAHRRKHGIRLYNVLFPAWMFYLFPSWLWLVILPANFAVDSLVLCLAMRRLGIAGRREIWRKSIIPIWAVGFLSDFLGALLTLGLMLLIDAFHPGFSDKIPKHDDSNRLISNNINCLRTDYQEASSSCF